MKDFQLEETWMESSESKETKSKLFEKMSKVKLMRLF